MRSAGSPVYRTEREAYADGRRETLEEVEAIIEAERAFHEKLVYDHVKNPVNPVARKDHQAVRFYMSQLLREIEKLPREAANG